MQIVDGRSSRPFAKKKTQKTTKQKTPKHLKQQLQGMVSKSWSHCYLFLFPSESLNGSGPVSRFLSCLDKLCLMFGIFSIKNSNQSDLNPFLEFVVSKIKGKYIILLLGKHSCFLSNPEETGSEAPACAVIACFSVSNLTVLMIPSP